MWNQRRVETIYELTAENCVAQLEGSDEVFTPAGFEAYWNAWINAVPDVRMEIQFVAVDGEKAVVDWRARAHTSVPVSAYLPQGANIYGACLWSGCAAGSAADRASFGFVSRYQKGATIPTGATEFQFKAGGLSFHSTSYQWLVIAGARAQYRGEGRIQGDAAAYAFLITAIDGAVQGGGGNDRFRIKLWRIDTGDIVYDNQMGQLDDSDAATAIGGGSIVIHK